MQKGRVPHGNRSAECLSSRPYPWCSSWVGTGINYFNSDNPGSVTSVNLSFSLRCFNERTLSERLGLETELGSRVTLIFHLRLKPTAENAEFTVPDHSKAVFIGVDLDDPNKNLGYNSRWPRFHTLLALIQGLPAVHENHFRPPMLRLGFFLRWPVCCGICIMRTRLDYANDSASRTMGGRCWFCIPWCYLCMLIQWERVKRRLDPTGISDYYWSWVLTKRLIPAGCCLIAAKFHDLEITTPRVRAKMKVFWAENSALPYLPLLLPPLRLSFPLPFRYHSLWQSLEMSGAALDKYSLLSLFFESILWGECSYTKWKRRDGWHSDPS